VIGERLGGRDGAEVAVGPILCSDLQPVRGRKMAAEGDGVRYLSREGLEVERQLAGRSGEVHEELNDQRA